MTGVSLQQGKSAPGGSCMAMGSRFWSRAHGRKPENPASFKVPVSGGKNGWLS